nr:transposase [Leisingera aquimarina]
MAAHFGLTLRHFQSGEHDNPGGISKAGDRDVRATLYAAANALLMRTMAGSQIKTWGMRLMRTKGRRRAVVASPANWPFCCTACGQMAQSSVRKRWRARHDLKRSKHNLNGVVPHRTRFVDEAENGCCATRRASLSKALHCQSDTCVQRYQ